MATSVTMPALGESVTEGTVTTWLKQVGDTVELDEPIVEVSTDTVDSEVPSPSRASSSKFWFPRMKPSRSAPRSHASATPPRPRPPQPLRLPLRRSPPRLPPPRPPLPPHRLRAPRSACPRWASPSPRAP